MLVCSDCGEPYGTTTGLGVHRRDFPNGSCRLNLNANPQTNVAVNGPLHGPLGAEAHTPQQQQQQQQQQHDEPQQDHWGQELQLEHDQVSPSHPAAFDSKFEFCKLMTGWANGQGAAAADIKLLCDLIHHPDFKIAEVPYTPAEVAAFCKDLVQQADDGWVTTTLHLDSWPEPVQLRHCDGLEVIRQLFTHPGLQEEVVLHAAKAYSGTVHDERHRVFDEPWQGDAWIDEQAEVQAKHGIDAVIAALQFYSDKTSVNKNTHFYPFEVALLNLPHGDKCKHIKKIAYIPVLRQQGGMSDARMSLARRELLSKALPIIVDSLRVASHKGFTCVINNVQRNIYPRLLTYVADDPEQRAILQIYVSGLVQRPCCRCLIKYSQLADVGLQATLRTLGQYEDFSLQVEGAATPKLAQGIKKKYSCHGAPALLGFAGQRHLSCDPYQVFGYEFMHNWSLGVMSQVVSYIKPYVDRTMARRGAGTNILRCLDVRLLLVPRAEGFRLPTYSRYFSKPANITASEHQAVSQVLPHLVHGLLDDDQLTDVVATACQTGMSLYRRNLPPGVTARELRRIDESIVILVSTMQEMFEPDGTVGTPKVHKLSHATGDIRRWGQLKHINADFFEGQHIDIKNVYRLVSRRLHGEFFLGQVVYKLQVLTAFERFSASLGKGDSKKEYKTAFMTAYVTGQHTLCGNYQRYSLTVLKQRVQVPGVLPTIGQRSLQFAALSPALPLLQHRLREYLLGRRLGFGSAYTRAARAGSLPAAELIGDTIRVHKSAVLAAAVPWDDDSTRLQTVRANPSFHGKPFFDCVAVTTTTSSVGSSNPRHSTQYAQLLLLLQVQLPDEQTGVPQWEQLAYVRWFSISREVDALTKHGAVALTWDTVQDAAADEVRCRESLVPLDSIARRVYVVPDFSRVPELQLPPSNRGVVAALLAEQQQRQQYAKDSPMDASLSYSHFHVSPFKW